MNEKQKYVDPSTIKMIDLMRDNKVVRFAYFRDGDFWYQHEDGLLFSISLQEATSSKVTFLAEDRAMLFMRWIKRFIEQAKRDKENSHPPLTQSETIEVAKQAEIV